MIILANSVDFRNSVLLNNQNQQKSPTSNILGKDDFLKLLMTQMQNQDPLNPMQDKDYIAQMATFSSLEQLTNMNTMLENFFTYSAENSLIQYSDMIGKKIDYTDVVTKEDGTTEATTGNGTVKSVHFKDYKVMLELEDGKMINAIGVNVISKA
ncbi:MAG: flagellar hook assembly protein FlgD [Bacillales bacterium]|nr:flagellar hook assembly protein FlgD [Bacillales bacterium]